jgi:hypothetical protein
MKNKIPLAFVLGLVMINLLSNSCKKDANSNIPHLLTSGTWQLATIQVTTYLGDATTSTFTLNDSCKQTQFFTFHTDNTCTYTNFSCLTQTTSGTWSLTQNRLFLISDMAVKDTVPGSKGPVRDTITTPFKNTQIATLGVYSLVLQTGDIQPNYSPTSKRRIVRYGFIKQKAVTQ